MCQSKSPSVVICVTNTELPRAFALTSFVPIYFSRIRKFVLLSTEFFLYALDVLFEAEPEKLAHVKNVAVVD